MWVWQRSGAGAVSTSPDARLDLLGTAWSLVGPQWQGVAPEWRSEVPLRGRASSGAGDARTRGRQLPWDHLGNISSALKRERENILL
jgi:hypothetical protein